MLNSINDLVNFPSWPSSRFCDKCLASDYLTLYDFCVLFLFPESFITFPNDTLSASHYYQCHGIPIVEPHKLVYRPSKSSLRIFLSIYTTALLIDCNCKYKLRTYFGFRTLHGLPYNSPSHCKPTFSNNDVSGP